MAQECMSKFENDKLPPVANVEQVRLVYSMSH
jgi:hypothetical protein